MPNSTPNLHKTDAQITSAAPQKKPKLAFVVGYFGIGYVLASAIMMMVQSQFFLNPQLVTALSILVGAYITVHKFTKHHKRALSKREGHILALGGALIVWVLSAIYFLALWFWVFDAVSREVLIDMAMQQPLPLVFAASLMIVFTLIAARLSLWIINRLLDPARKRR